MRCHGLPFLCCILTSSLFLLHCTSLSQDGLILIKLKKEHLRDKFNAKALRDWNEFDRNPCSWNGISCDTFNTVTKVDLTHFLISGKLTSAICGLPNLTALILQRNYFSGPFPHGLLRCKHLRKLDLSDNCFDGSLPSRISRLSELRELNLASNNFNGFIPLPFGMLPRLKVLHLHDNRLNGTLNVLRNLKTLTNFTITNNPLHPGMVPRWLGDSRHLRELGLGNCNLFGRIPDFFDNLAQLERLDMSYNNLLDNIPSSLMNLPRLRELHLSHNTLSGKIPGNIHHLRSLSALYLDQNNLSGQIPANFHHLRSLRELLLNDNALTGRIPSDIEWDLLDFFHIFSNQFSGLVPDVLDNQSYAHLVLPNPGLCGGRNLELPSCSSPHKIFNTSVFLPLIIISLALSSICLCRWFRKKRRIDTPSCRMTPFISTAIDGSYILCNLKESNLIGSGSGGKVFKVILPNSEAVAVKNVCRMSTSGQSLERNRGEVEKGSREAEEKTVGLVRHRNIIKLLCSISVEESDSKLLVFEFMSNGSLFDCLHGDPQQEMILPWPIRYKIVLGAARGLSYIHHDCSPPILHRDVKSSNILLDADFEAKIADFGISRLLDKLGDGYMASGYVGSHGYIAPEYGHGLNVSEKTDIYSFGVVLLEVVSGKKATNEAAYDEGVELVQWTRNTITMSGGEEEVLDWRVKEESCVEQMLRVLRVGLLCTNRNPRSRPSMRTVVEMLISC